MGCIWIDGELEEIESDTPLREAEESQITSKDINDISSALKFGYDSITISNATRSSQI